MTKEAYVNLQHSESVIATMAATIFAAYVQNREVNDANEAQYIEKAVDTAVRLATHTDRVVKSDEEFMRSDSGTQVVL